VFAARQFVSHGHVKVNGKRVTIPSIRLKVGDVIELTERAKEMVAVQEAQASADRDTPDYLEIAGGQVKMTRVPALSEVPYPVQMEPNLVVEFYSR
jgi:small subunit ribosomal protein S4